MSRYYPIPAERLLALLLRRTAYGCAEFDSASPFRARIAARRDAWLASLSPADHAALDTIDREVRDQLAAIRADSVTRTPETAHDRAH
jgi:hypothetical protein